MSVDGLLGTGDHKAIGRLWILSGLVFGLAGLVLRLVAAVDQVGRVLADDDQLVQVWSAGRELMLFGGVVAIFVGLATFIVPLQVGSSAIAFARGAAAAYWVWLVSASFVVIGYLANGGPGGGKRDFVALWAAALGAMLIATVWALICVATTALGARASGMTLDLVPLSTWSFLVFALYGIFTLPVAVGQLVLAWVDVKSGYISTADTTMLFGVTEQVFTAPAIYWLAIPILGIAAEVIGVHTGAPIRFRRSIMVAIGVLAVVAFAADNLSFIGTGAGPRQRPGIDFSNGILVMAILASIVPVLATLGLTAESLRKGSAVARTPLAAALASGLLLLVGMGAALLGLIHPVLDFISTVAGGDPIDVPDALQLNGTSFNAGISGLVIAAGVLGVIAGIQHWGHKMWGHTMDERVGMLAILSAAGGGLVWGLGEIIAGFADQTALPAISDPGGAADLGKVLALAGIAGVAAGLAFAAVNAISGGVAGRGSMSEPWKGETLEWLTESPPPLANFDGPVTVRSSRPLVDIAADALAAESSSEESSTGKTDSEKTEVTA